MGPILTNQEGTRCKRGWLRRSGRICSPAYLKLKKKFQCNVCIVIIGPNISYNANRNGGRVCGTNIHTITLYVVKYDSSLK